MPGRRSLDLAFVLLLVLAFGVRASFVERTSPYPLQEDEALIAVPASRTVERGEWNPHFFKYPSLPIYLTAGGLALGRALDGGDDPSVGRVGRPFYTRPATMETARLLFALLSVAGMGLAAWAGARAFGERAILVLAPLLLASSDRYLLQSWMYLNVDIVGACVCAGATALLFATRGREGLLWRAVLPGVVTGFAVGSKYYLGLVGLPFALVLLERRHRPRLVRNAAVIALATVVGFLVTTPYAVLDHERFLDQVVFELQHYSTGHEGGEGEPGLPQLLYYLGQLRREFGWGTGLLALLGAAAAWRRDRWAAVLFLVFPLALLAFLCTQRVHFPRNLTSFYVLLPSVAAYGAIVAARQGAARLARVPGAAVLSGAAVAALVLVALPWKRTLASYSVPTDSRTLAAEWILANRAPGTRVLVAAELQMDVSLLADHDVTVAPLAEFVRPGMNREYADERPVFVLPDVVPGTRFAKGFEEALRPAERLERRAAYGRNLLPRALTRLVHMGDPRLLVLEPSP